MPWVGAVGALVQAWYSGNEAGNAIADVLYGKVNPAGRLPLTLPVRVEDIPAHFNHRSENGKIQCVTIFGMPNHHSPDDSYREDLFVGYKHYQARGVTPLFPFGSVLLLLITYLQLTTSTDSACHIPTSHSPDSLSPSLRRTMSTWSLRSRSL